MNFETLLSSQYSGWSAKSWQAMPVHMQQVAYKDEELLDRSLASLSELPALVTPEAIEAAREKYLAAAQGEAFILVGGDCAENFSDVKDHIIGQKMDLLSNQAQAIESVTGIPVHITARLAGQYSKPRSQLMETLADGSQVHAFRGHNINGHALTEREPDPKRLLQGYWHSLAVLHKLASSR
jgi:3-deoxy-7-phosphoheptulonate synthase